MRIYDADFGPTAETVAVDLVELTPADDKPIVVLRAGVHQTTDYGDAQEEIISNYWARGNTSSGSGGTAAANPNPRNPSDATSGVTFESLNTTAASSGTVKKLGRRGWNVRMEQDVAYLPEERVEASQGNTLLCWRLDAAPADSLTIGGGVVIGESG